MPLTQWNKRYYKKNNFLENRGIFSKGTIKKIANHVGGFLNFLTPLISVYLPLMKNLLIPLANSVLVPLGLKAVVSATDASIQGKSNAWGTTYKICVEEMNSIMKIVKYVEYSSLLITGVCQTFKNESSKQKLDFLVFCWVH